MADKNPRGMNAEFERARPHLRAVAFRLLGSVVDADDALQEAWLRAAQHDVLTLENPTGWLTVLVSHVCLDVLKRRRRGARYREADGALEAATSSPEEQQLLAESVGLAMLVVLERLTPR